MNMDQNFRQLLNETRDAEKEFPEEIKEAQQPGKGPDKSPELKGKDPQLDNVNEEEDVSGVDDSEPMAAAGEPEVEAEEPDAVKDALDNASDEQIKELYAEVFSPESMRSELYDLSKGEDIAGKILDFLKEPAEQETEEVVGEEDGEIPTGEPEEEEI